MRITGAMIAVLLLALSAGVCWGQTVEVAVRCEQITGLLAKLEKVEDRELVDKMVAAIGAAVLVSCDRPQARVTCYQCLDREEKLQPMQIVRDPATGRFSSGGPGCRCQEGK